MSVMVLHDGISMCENVDIFKKFPSNFLYKSKEAALLRVHLLKRHCFVKVSEVFGSYTFNSLEGWKFQRPMLTETQPTR